MFKLTSPRQRAANRVNAVRSTGPKSHQGKIRASLNATKHALTKPVDVSPWGKHLDSISNLLVAEGLDQGEAQDVAKKILDYERNAEYQRKRFVDLRDGVSSDEDPPEIFLDLWVADRLDRGAKNKNPLFEEKLDKEIAKFFRQVAEGRLSQIRNEAIKTLRNADRHLRRSALQLSKALRSSEA